MHASVFSTQPGTKDRELPNASVAVEQIKLALESNNQVAFDWLIATDSLHFSGPVFDVLEASPLHTTKAWKSCVFPTLMHEDDKEPFAERLRAALKDSCRGDGALYKVEVRLKGADGVWRWVEISGKVIERDSDGRAIRMVGTLSDIDDRKLKENVHLMQSQVLNMVVTGTPLGDILDEIERFIEARVGSALCRIHRLCEMEGSVHVRPSPHAASNPDSLIGESLSVRPAISGRGCDPSPVTKQNAPPENRWKAYTSIPIMGKSNNLLGSLTVFFQHSARPTPTESELLRIGASLACTAIESRMSEERIRYLAHYDGLTSLPNRFLFKEYIDLALRNAQRHGNRFAVLFLDLDRFKEVNDTLGHDAGDHVLREIAWRLRSCLRGSDKIARMGGDEFYVLIEELTDGRHVSEVAGKLLQEAARPVRVGDEECRLSVSIGISIYPDDGQDGASLILNADNAMYQAKKRGKNAFHFHATPTAHSPIRHEKRPLPCAEAGYATCESSNTRNRPSLRPAFT